MTRPCCEIPVQRLIAIASRISQPHLASSKCSLIDVISETQKPRNRQSLNASYPKFRPRL
ncbi:hypothetical protein BRAS3809_2800007 [Bradyrhizobium sp. STM 3809]|nr:hypothetical protein BRAS3809_2800007 [Bradyrhizobium sp. STM 3809]